jgi:hypothetical protein
MKKLILFAAFAALAMPLSAKADIVIAGIDTWDDTAAPTVAVIASDVTATAALTTFGSGEGGGNAGRGSSKDTTWGTFSGPAASAVTNTSQSNVSLFNGAVSGDLTFTIVNNSADSLQLNDVHFDAIAFRPNVARTWSVNVLAGSDIPVGNLFTSGLQANDNSTNAITRFNGGGQGPLLTDDTDPLTHDQHDDINLSDFATIGAGGFGTLATGQQAIIQIAFAEGTGSGGGHHLFLDNAAVSGDFIPAAAIPEPSSLALLGLAGMCGLVRRRK